jgi:transposase InsO family protein
MKRLKCEEVYPQDSRDMADVRALIEHILQKVHNERRLHSALGYRPLGEFEQAACTPVMTAQRGG